MYKIALVEDEKNLASLVIKYLKNEGYEVVWFETGEQAIKQIKSDINLWILDIMLPGIISGYDLIKAIKIEHPTMPIIFTSARNQDIDKIMGLELGSDDYVSKPYSIRELVLRVKNLLFRSYNSSNMLSKDLEIGEYVINKEKRSVSYKGEIINLTSKEFDLLIYLIDHPGLAFSREQILDNVWGEEYYGSDRVVDDLMRRLRNKLPFLVVETIYGYGYRLII